MHDNMDDVCTVKPIFLWADMVEDLPLLAGLVQDAMFPMMDTEFRKSEQIFVMIINRFVWEWDIPPYYRTHTILHFSQVISVESQHMHRPDARIYTILSIIPVPAADNTIWLYISLAGGATLRIQVKNIDIILKDVGNPWHTATKPTHDSVAIRAI